MTISAKIVADSLSPTGARLTSMELRYPRFIHAELMTHRVFSRNASSSRAIPVPRLIQDVMTDPAIPSHWGKNQPGMQAREEHKEQVLVTEPNGNSWTPYFHKGPAKKTGTHDWKCNPIEAWLISRDLAVMQATRFSEAGYHKQIVNRLLEPFSHINVIVTATEWLNFYNLRRHPDAQPEIKLLADAMWEAQQASAPIQLAYGDWHTPYVEGVVLSRQMISAARCARVSYKTHDGGEPDWAKDDLLAKDLLASKHMSPFEHQARPLQDRWGKSGNFVGWHQFRQQLQ